MIQRHACQLLMLLCVSRRSWMEDQQQLPTSTHPPTFHTHQWSPVMTDFGGAMFLNQLLIPLARLIPDRPPMMSDGAISPQIEVAPLKCLSLSPGRDCSRPCLTSRQMKDTTVISTRPLRDPLGVFVTAQSAKVQTLFSGWR